MLGSSSRSEQPATSSELPVTRVPCPIGHVRVELGPRHAKPRETMVALWTSPVPRRRQSRPREIPYICSTSCGVSHHVRRLHVLTSIGSAVPTRVMEAKEAASFVRLSESEFERMAPRLPRYAVTERRYIYLPSELLAWLLGR